MNQNIKLCFLLLLVFVFVALHTSSALAAPIPFITDPVKDELLHGSHPVICEDQVDISAVDLNDIPDVAQTVFEYSSNGSDWYLLEVDSDPHVEPIGFDQKGESTDEARSGWETVWDTSLLSEGQYYLRIRMTDSYGNPAEYTSIVNLDRTPPIPDIVLPGFDSHMSGLVSFQVDTEDTDVTTLELEFLPYNEVSSIEYLGTKSTQKDLGNKKQGDVGPDGDDGINRFCVPTAIKNALDRLAKKDPRIYPPVVPGEDRNTTMVKELMRKLGTDQRWGTAPGDVFRGIIDYLRERGLLPSEYYTTRWRNGKRKNGVSDANFKNYKSQIRSGEAVVIEVGIYKGPGKDGKNPSKDDVFSGRHMLTGEDENNKPDRSGDYDVSFVDPKTGKTVNCKWHPGSGPNGYDQIEYDLDGDGQPNRVDVISMIAISPAKNSPTPGFQTIGFDSNGADGWTVDWDTAGLPSGYYVVAATLTDDDNNSGTVRTVIYVRNMQNLSTGYNKYMLVFLTLVLISAGVLITRLQVRKQNAFKT
jgi:hypothetical protein